MAGKKTGRKKPADLPTKPSPYSDGQTFGRPKVYKPEYCADLIQHLKEGFSLASFGATLGEKYGDKFAVCRDTIFDWLNNYPDFSDAYATGRQFAMKFYETVGKSGMTGQLRRVKSETPVMVDGKPLIGPDGKIVYKREYDSAHFSAAVWNFTMMNRFGWKGREKVETPDGKAKASVGDAVMKLMGDPEMAKAALAIAEKLAEE